MAKFSLQALDTKAWRHAADLLIRFALGLTFAYSAGVCLQTSLVGFQHIDFEHPKPGEIGHMLSVLVIGLYTLMIACLYVLRLRPVSKFAGAIPCAAAILGGFLMSALLLLSPREDLPLWARITASLLVVVGNAFAIMIILRLGRSFSILPEGRRLVTSGPYAVVRHPLYLAEAVATLGAVINFLSPWALLLVVVQLGLQMVRIHYEEKVLKESFPEYEDYAQRTWRLIPGIY
jgi:protein-S-isoprenylcysteine O-methyltransferase Ste14